jgi:hypothetical protein
LITQSRSERRAGYRAPTTCPSPTTLRCSNLRSFRYHSLARMQADSIASSGQEDTEAPTVKFTPERYSEPGPAAIALARATWSDDFVRAERMSSSNQWQPSRLPSDYWERRRPYVVMNGNDWIGEPDAHHDSAPVEVAGAGSSQGEIYDDRVRPYQHRCA